MKEESKDKSKETKKRNKSLIIDGIKYKTRLSPKYEKKKKYVAKDIRDITAFIPGTILDIFVSTAQEVKKGDPLLTLEAMKMHNILRSPIDGKIKEIKVKKNTHVVKNELLIVLE